VSPLNPVLPPRPPLSQVLADLRRLLAPDGLEHVGAAAIGPFNAGLQGPESRFRLPDLGSTDHAVIVIGHGRGVWAPFRAALRADPGLLADPDPFDRWTAARISEAVARALPMAVARALRHVWEGPPRLVPMQALAVHVGLGVRGPAGLVVHPERGPWIAFRAALIVALPFPGPTPSEQLNPAPCGMCRERPCVPAYERALAASNPAATSARSAGLGPAWAPWLALRDACPVGRDVRYSESQIRYHYARDRAALREDPKTED
jgi:methylmalonic aciduria homocystinuria type C protein